MESIITLLLLILLQAVLGFDNLLYISLESKRAPEGKQGFARRMGIGLAIIMRIVLLFGLMHLIKYFQDPFYSVDTSFIHGEFNVHSLIVLVGGIFIVYTAMKEIWHMLRLEHDKQETSKKSLKSVIFWIIIMNIIFSFDSILSAMALTDEFWVMAAAIVFSGLLMMWMSDRVSNFLKKNRMYEVLGLFILFVVGIMLITEGGHLAHMKLFGSEITPMSKTTFYFIIAIMVVVEIVQSQYQKRLDGSNEKGDE